MCHKHLHASQSWALSSFLLYQCFLSMFSKLNLHKDNSWFLCSLFDKALTMIVHAFTIHFIFYFIYHKNQPCSSQFTPYPSSPSLNSFVCHSKRRDANKSSYQNNQIIRFCITRIQKEFISYSRLFQTSFGSKAHLNRILLAMMSLFQLTSKKWDTAPLKRIRIKGWILKDEFLIQILKKKMNRPITFCGPQPTFFSNSNLAKHKT